MDNFKKNNRQKTAFKKLKIKNLIQELENKLPNEFKGNINNFNYHSMSGELHIDENCYKY